MVVVGAAVVVVEVVVVEVVDVVVVVTPAHTNNELDNRYNVPPLVPVVPFEPVGNNVCDALGINPATYEEVTAKLDVTDTFANNVAFSG